MWDAIPKFTGLGQETRETLEPETVQIILSKLEKLDQLEQALDRNVTTVPEQEAQAQIPETPITKQAEIEAKSEPVALLPAVSGVSPDEVKSVIDAYLSGIAKCDICSHLRWSSRKYTSIVKPFLTSYRKRGEQMEIQKLRDGLYRLSAMHEGITLSARDLRDIHNWVEAHKVELDKEELERIERELGSQEQEGK